MEKERAQTLVELNRLREYIKTAAEPSSDEVDRLDVYEREKNLALVRRLEQKVEEIDKALQTAKKRTYGICQRCGKPIDPERLKLVSQQMVLERKVRLAYHSWAAQPIVEAGAVRGVVFESKAGRRAIFAQVTVDATGDGDLFARAGAACETDIEESDIHHCMNTSWLFGGVDMPRWLAWKAGQPQQFAAFMQRWREGLRFFDKPFVAWRDDIALFMGPRQAGYSRRSPSSPRHFSKCRPPAFVDC